MAPPTVSGRERTRRFLEALRDPRGTPELSTAQPTTQHSVRLVAKQIVSVRKNSDSGLYLDSSSIAPRTNPIRGRQLTL